MNPSTAAAWFLQADGSVPVKVNVKASPIAICLLVDSVIDLVIENLLQANVHALEITLDCCNTAAASAYSTYPMLL